MAELASVLLTGASSGLGRALALACAAPGVTLHLGGRDAGRLARVAEECGARGASVHAHVADVRDAAAMAAWIGGAGRLDLVVANAGIGGGSDDGAPESPDQVRAIFATNLEGALNVALPALAAMRLQAPGVDGVRGRIATIASVAAFVPAPGAASYCAAKAALDAWAVGTAPTARSHGVRLTSVCPGYVRTAMTARNRFPMPGLMDADRAAAIILRGIAAGRVRIAFPWWVAGLARLTGLLPPRLAGVLLSRAPGKAGLPAEPLPTHPPHP
jgi:NAD(P)-dependent dehydrogenase (short-subunit alcohol dehydrogenase family)